MTVPRILLIRHGRSTHRSWGEWVDAAGVLRWRDAYDRAGIDPQVAPPPSLVEAVARCGAIVSSDLPRAMESAEHVARGRHVQHSPLLREAPLPVLSLPLRLPVVVWDSLATMHWGYRILRGADATPADRQRAADAVTWLGGLGQVESPLAVVTHGIFRRLLANHLRTLGWRVWMPRPRYEYWSVWTAEHPAGDANYG